ncbi:hypothetical protein BC6_00070 [Bacillus phage BC-6]|nr:hypothetical protein BC6_00070 [Bacillus phage BC-6]
MKLREKECWYHMNTLNRIISERIATNDIEAVLIHTASLLSYVREIQEIRAKEENK